MKYEYKKIYKTFNLTILFLCVGMIFMPAFIYIIKNIFPEFYSLARCPYYSFTHNPCPFCGITTDFKSILTGHIFAYKYNIISIPLFIFIIIEINFRFFLIKLKKISIEKIIKIDLIYHLFFIILIILYIILFFKLKLARF